MSTETNAGLTPERVEALLRKLIWHGADTALLMASGEHPELVHLRRKIREEVADYAAEIDPPPEWNAIEATIAKLRADAKEFWDAAGEWQVRAQNAEADLSERKRLADQLEGRVRAIVERAMRQAVQNYHADAPVEDGRAAYVAEIAALLREPSEGREPDAWIVEYRPAPGAEWVNGDLHKSEKRAREHAANARSGGIEARAVALVKIGTPSDSPTEEAEWGSIRTTIEAAFRHGYEKGHKEAVAHKQFQPETALCRYMKKLPAITRHVLRWADLRASTSPEGKQEEYTVRRAFEHGVTFGSGRSNFEKEDKDRAFARCMESM